MTISKEVEAAILRYHFVEKWAVGTIATQLCVHHSTVERILSQAGIPRPKKEQPSILDPYLPFIVETLKKFPNLTAARLFGMVKERGYPGRISHFRSRIVIEHSNGATKKHLMAPPKIAFSASN